MDDSLLKEHNNIYKFIVLARACCSKPGKDNPGLVRNWNSDMKA